MIETVEEYLNEVEDRLNKVHRKSFGIPATPGWFELICERSFEEGLSVDECLDKVLQDDSLVEYTPRKLKNGGCK
ncbi:MAG: hypothetical protein GWO20_10160 [Candidatus Korarchaeota archaeon]|nr:hypothetical protein [Candidatus Korarchaeota archaeon]NIU83880.1 hypothetical protein [Candidatus Thorarchaeota archaeon]NIW14026.1 hypothetical protein [Candidatus Thorarchaeota archaeon]